MNFLKVLRLSSPKIVLVIYFILLITQQASAIKPLQINKNVQIFENIDNSKQNISPVFPTESKSENIFRSPNSVVITTISKNPNYKSTSENLSNTLANQDNQFFTHANSNHSSSFSTINFTEKIIDESLVSSRSQELCKSTILGTLAKFPSSHFASLKTIELFYEKNATRGGANANFLKIRCNDITDSELKAVLVHELGHIVDGGMLQGFSEENSSFEDLGKSVKKDDASVEFYSISWKNNTEKNSSSKKQDFCSSYSQTNPYEDFAECYIYYALHPDLFEEKTKDSLSLKKKFEFMRDKIFAGEIIVEKSQTQNKLQVYDNTKLAHSL